MLHQLGGSRRQCEIQSNWVVAIIIARPKVTPSVYRKKIKRDWSWCCQDPSKRVSFTQLEHSLSLVKQCAAPSFFCSLLSASHSPVQFQVSHRAHNHSCRRIV